MNITKLWKEQVINGDVPYEESMKTVISICDYVKENPEQIYRILPFIDTILGISESVKHLRGLNALKLARHKIRYDSDKATDIRLNKFIVHGRWVLDTMGNFMKITEGLGRIIPIVTSLNNSYNISFSMISAYNFPSPNDICPECNEGWNIDNCHDHTLDWKDNTGYHTDCYKTHHDKNIKENILNCFKEYKIKKVTSIANEYCDCNHCASWFKVETDTFNFKVGWRKRVIELTILDAEFINFEKVFKEEDVTKGRYYIHAWGYTELTRYLDKFVLS